MSESNNYIVAELEPDALDFRINEIEALASTGVKTDPDDVLELILLYRREKSEVAILKALLLEGCPLLRKQGKVLEELMKPNIKVIDLSNVPQKLIDELYGNDGESGIICTEAAHSDEV